ncbi:MAG: hypothetical protein LBC85_05055 [Fibromonadaceae bacterium]|jgi:hypothetical protein|nr:hypothetical protein [Fibromonadaceae bacterium]
MQISNIYAQNSAEQVKRTGDSAIQIKKETQKNKAATENASANVSISGSGQSSIEALVQTRANALPEIREEKISLARERAESGYYNTPEFSKELSSRLVDG